MLTICKEQPNGVSTTAGAEDNRREGEWKDRLELRQFRFPASRESESDLAVRIEHAGTRCCFPLGTSNVETATVKARHIYQVVEKRGWNVARKRFSHELIINFHWSTSPVFWTYATINTLIRKENLEEPNPAASNGGDPMPVYVVESDAGVRRALCWSVNQHAGFCGVPCDSMELYNDAISSGKPGLALLNRNMNGLAGSESIELISQIRPGAWVLRYSVCTDRDQMFASTPGGAEAYVIKRVQPDRLLEPILKSANRAQLDTGNLQFRVRAYFQEWPQPRSSEGGSPLASLTRREYGVLALLSKGQSDKQIANALGLSVWTVHDYVKEIFGHLRVHSRIEAAIRFMELANG
jgi:DNA-binding NarL/FixJ family response regulator